MTKGDQSRATLSQAVSSVGMGTVAELIPLQTAGTWIQFPVQMSRVGEMESYHIFFFSYLRFRNLIDMFSYNKKM